MVLLLGTCVSGVNRAFVKCIAAGRSLQFLCRPEHLLRIQVRVYGDAATKAHEQDMSHDRAMWISNHRTRIDWMLLWSVAWRTRTLQHLRIVLKAPLRSVPVFGWAMQHFVFVFLVRSVALHVIGADQRFSHLFVACPLPVCCSNATGKRTW